MKYVYKKNAEKVNKPTNIIRKHTCFCKVCHSVMRTGLFVHLLVSGANFDDTVEHPRDVIRNVSSQSCCDSRTVCVCFFQAQRTAVGGSVASVA